MSDVSSKKIVIVGAGFGGVYVARYLAKTLPNSQISIINKTNYFLFTPLLHEVATGSLSDLSVAESLSDVFKNKPNVSVVVGTVDNIDYKKKTVSVGEDFVDFDFLIIATGAKTNHYGVDKNEVLELKTLKDATLIREQIIDSIDNSLLLSGEEREKKLTFAVVGAGPTGVELVCEMADFINDSILKNYPNNEIKNKKAKIFLINATGSMADNYSFRVKKYIADTLSQKHITVMLGKPVDSVKSGEIYFSDGSTMSAGTIVWTAGIKPDMPSCGENITLEKGRIVVDDFLQVCNMPGVFALGDVAFLPGSVNFQLAQIATRQAKVVALNILSLIKEKEMSPFVYKIKGTLVSLGKWRAAGQIMGLSITGFFAWFIWRTIYLFKFHSFRKQIKIAIEWTGNLFFPRDTTRE